MFTRKRESYRLNFFPFLLYGSIKFVTFAEYSYEYNMNINRMID
jgi:hypothetical protein